MKAYVDPDTCSGCGTCAEICPEVFEVGEAIAEVIVDPVPPEFEDAVLEAADSCPSESISCDED